MQNITGSILHTVDKKGILSIARPGHNLPCPQLGIIDCPHIFMIFHYRLLKTSTSPLILSWTVSSESAYMHHTLCTMTSTIIHTTSLPLTHFLGLMLSHTTRYHAGTWRTWPSAPSMIFPLLPILIMFNPSQTVHTNFLFLDLLCSLDMAAMGTDEQVECGLVVEDIRVKEQFGIASRVINGKD